MGVLRNLEENNEYPIIFIGSGMSKRYLENFPSWDELLKEYWEKLNENLNFYGYLSKISREIEKEHQNISKDELTYLTNIRAAQEIETQFNELFMEEKIKVPNLDVQTAYQDKISPFKKSIAEKFKTYQFKEDCQSEIELFTQFIRKAQIIVTTNYDTFIEDIFNYEYDGKITTYVGHRGFFDQTEGWSELFKIHGSVEDPNSIVITKSDYDLYDKKSILISAKLIAALVQSPIIFLGYSLTDVNVQNMISDFASQLPKEDSRKSAQRIIIVERDEGNESILEEKLSDHNKGWHYTLLKTDNFKKLFEELTKVNQGLSPYHVRKYHQVIKKLVVDKGKKGSLDAVLLSPQELDAIEDKIDTGKPIVLALGDKAHIYKMPNAISYMNDYVFGKQEIMTDVALRYVASQSSHSRIPFAKYVKDVDLEKVDITTEEKEKILQRIQNHGSLEEMQNSISRFNRQNYNNIGDILNEEFNNSRKIDLVVYNIDNFKDEEIEAYVKEQIEQNFATSTNQMEKTSLRRLAAAYDLKLYGDLKI
ncbi:SIR2 family protein [Bacillus altitudinis]|uniref:SIR2 family protein n=1 Tax=Bacillus altitudinis TaxID=293387 RepID=UPI00234DF0F6|nr:SIR2 family protein [Bacillus altitudinis]MDC7794984.1 SIR2 family protein [Bacillus altitudinis]